MQRPGVLFVRTENLFWQQRRSALVTEHQPVILGTTTLDFHSDPGVRVALEMAKARHEDVTLFHCVKPPPFPHSQKESDLKTELDLAYKLFEEQCKRLRLKVRPESVIRVGHPGRSITSFAQELKASFIVLGPHRPRGVLDGLLGGTTDYVIRDARVPCLRVTHRVAAPPKRMIFGTDFSEAAEQALAALLEWLAAFPFRSGARSACLLEVVYVQAFASGLGGQVRTTDYGRFFRELLGRLSVPEGIKVRTKVVGAPTVLEGLERAAEDSNSDIVALGTHGHRPLVRLLLGSVAFNCSQRLNFPVLLLPPV